MKKIYILFCCSLLLFTIKAEAQTDSLKFEDYVITVKGDTLKCAITFPLMTNGRYTLPGTDKSQKMDIKKIKEFYTTRKDDRERAVIKGDTSNKAVFLKVVENGKISLYEEIYTRYSFGMPSGSTTEWYIGKGSDLVTELKTSALISIGKSRKKRKDILGDMLKDKPEVYDKYVANDKFSFKEVQDLVHFYNTGETEAPKHDNGVVRAISAF